jgi:SAM-dependent methyltransferase
MIAKIDLNTERMHGRGDIISGTYKVNKLYGLEDFCKKYISKETKLLELGCNDGISTRLFCYYSNNVTGVDKNKTKKITELINTNNNFLFHHMSFEKFFNINTDNFDIIYIDGNHIFKDVVRDIENSLSIIKNNGIISGHDYWITDVIKVVKHFFHDYNIELFSDSTWVVKLENKI